eukprot:5532946-Alexandrium_andersonii.AAC.1
MRHAPWRRAARAAAPFQGVHPGPRSSRLGRAALMRGCLLRSSSGSRWASARPAAPRRSKGCGGGRR